MKRWSAAFATSAAAVLLGEKRFAGTEPEQQQQPPPLRPRMRVRKASTRLSAIDNIVVVYEQRLRETAPLEKVFRYFSSLVVGGRGKLCCLLRV